MAVDAVVRNFEKIIGEAARNLPEEIRLRHPGVAWREAVGFRNVLIHEYFGVDAEVLWETVKTD
ncbi:MAG TPA: HepT-like ribonuclease domain-containing protein [Thermoanaerobaculia bacterium]|nr:HepT-like ribonuclease domain-containing protein [Thermoanaerobaculia bacterium]